MPIFPYWYKHNYYGIMLDMAIKVYYIAAHMTHIYTIKKIGVVASILTLCGCYQNIDAHGNAGLFTPTPILLRNLPKGEDDFSRGFRDACYNFIGQAGYGMSRLFDKSADPEFLKTDNLYWNGYRHGDRYCSVYVNKDINL